MQPTKDASEFKDPEGTFGTKSPLKINATSGYIKTKLTKKQIAIKSIKNANIYLNN